MTQLIEVADELKVSPNAVVLAWMMQSLTRIIPMVTGSTVAQLAENFEAISFSLTEEQLERLNQEAVRPNIYF
jgi:aryl-alcohol dehydrogenase-like predicted oxidoreductase